MTALNAFAVRDGVHLFTDGGWHNPDTGELLGIGNKVCALPEYNAVIAATGSNLVADLLSRYLIENRFADLQSLAVMMPDWLQACIEQAKAAPGGRDWGVFDVILAGWSEATGPIIRLCKSYEDGGWPAYTRKEPTGYMRPALEFKHTRDGSPNKRWETVPPEWGLNILRLQRTTPCVDPAGNQRFVVHGFAQHSHVGPQGISMRVLEHWPDAIGKSPEQP